MTSALCTDRNIFYPNTKVSRLLLLAGCSPNARTSYYNNAPLLSVAARHGLHDFSTLLLDFGADVHQVDDCRSTPLIHASIGGHLDLVQFFHLHGAEVDSVDLNWKCALVYAAEHGHVKIVSFLLQCDWTHCKDRGDERSGRLSRQQYIQQAFVVAAAAGHGQVCKFLLEFCDVRIDDPDPVTGETALSVSCRNGNRDVVSFLLDSGASVAYGKSSKPTPPLITAVESGYWEIVSSILARGLNVNNEQNEKLQTAVIVAAKSGHIGVLELLLSRGDCYSCARLLLERGANGQIFDRSGCYPIHFAAQYGSEQMIRLLIEHNAALECKNRNDYRPLEVALEAGNVHAAQRLLRRGAKLGRLTWKLVVNKPHFLIMLLEKLLQDANFFYKNHRIADAMCRLQYALKNIPGDAGTDLNFLSKFLNIRYHLFLGVARCKKKSNELGEAIQFATRAIELDSAQVDGYYFRARCYYDCRNWVAARADLSAVLKLCPNHKEALRSLSRLKQYLKSEDTAFTVDKDHKYSLLCKTDPATARNTPSVRTTPQLHSKNNWEQSSCDSGNAPDIDLVDSVNSNCHRPLNWAFSGKLQA
ncbi:unnamed protein product [Soboliphyme baturini]|uniref:ANK_REP_REGION domain-containing protein n=1 Tax=Soboliphyme baturini TaxID=241478 RepID=A0A183IKN3_9BILA|nr:unnamed protein product [Soboliphyme baturini]